jgi:hypothetical protein
MLALGIAAAATVEARGASLREQQSDEVWREQDKCARDAFQKFPDFTPGSNAARDRETRVCEAKNRLPPRLHESPVAKIPDSEAE